MPGATTGQSKANRWCACRDGETAQQDQAFRAIWRIGTHYSRLPGKTVAHGTREIAQCRCAEAILPAQVEYLLHWRVCPYGSTRRTSATGNAGVLRHCVREGRARDFLSLQDANPDGNVVVRSNRG
jgi:hypothetical protein